ncbi:ABC transporter permease [Ancylobacter radicis]|uniref:FtsX-like permease family protein n=1 Tax=Ancylobacter radicis TaxID=2836179 RepID=A0ABS5R571_9HYPH|nr:FtsX-like permease family protein [Ancylobacter radicis]MBS9476357.1 FtsX-like permease family protein [Ancylobacter radicis]
MLRFIAADLRRHWIGALAIMLIVALATALGVLVTLQERALRLGSARSANAFDLVVGAPGSETQLVLSSVFLQPAPLPLMPGSVLAGLIADPRVAWAAPVGFGDFVENYPIVGTTPALVGGIASMGQGRGFARLGEAVIGAATDLRIGDHFHPQHGRVGEPTGVHTEITYEVVGRLAATGTPWDRAVLVPIETVWLAHDHDHGGHDRAAGEEDAHAQDGHDADHDHDQSADHAVPAAGASSPPGNPFLPGTTRPDQSGSVLDTPLSDQTVADPHAPGVPAIVVKPRSIADAYKLRQQYRSDHTVAVFPGEVLTRLYSTLGDVRLILTLIAGGAQALVGFAILLVVSVHVVQRRRQIGALRALGAPRPAVFAIVWGEVLLIAGSGLVAGFALGYAGARLLSIVVTEASGMMMPVGFTAADLARLGALLALTALASALPALFAYRQSPAAALRG